MTVVTPYLVKPVSDSENRICRRRLQGANDAERFLNEPQP